jgi:hypothetical protein
MKKIFTEEGNEIFIDEQDYEFVSKFRFRNRDKPGDCRPRLSGGVLGPEHLILGQAKKGFVIDHIDRNPFNNCRNNLRIITQKNNSRNTSKTKRETTSRFKGVSWHEGARKFIAYITDNGKYHRLGQFYSEIEAAKAYNKKAKELFGEFAGLNDIPEDKSDQPFLPGLIQRKSKIKNRKSKIK